MLMISLCHEFKDPNNKQNSPLTTSYPLCDKSDPTTKDSAKRSATISLTSGKGADELFVYIGILQDPADSSYSRQAGSRALDRLRAIVWDRLKTSSGRD